LGEDTVADLWEQSWAQKWITRVEATSEGLFIQNRILQVE